MNWFRCHDCIGDGTGTEVEMLGCPPSLSELNTVWLGGEALTPFGARVVYIATNLLEGSLAVLHAVIPAVRHRNLAYLFEFTERRMVRFQQVVDQSSMGIGEGEMSRTRACCGARAREVAAACRAQSPVSLADEG